MSNSTSIFVIAEQIANKKNSLYENTAHCRKDLYNYLEQNNWLGLKCHTTDAEIIVSNDDYLHIEDAISLWLCAYKRTNNEKLAILCNHFKKQYPITCSLYFEFINSRGLKNEEVSWRLFDCILSHINREITEYSEEALDVIIQKIYSNATLSALKLFADFLATAKRNGDALTQWKYTFQHHGNCNRGKEAYELKSFSEMAYCIFNQDVWEKQNLIQKAISSKKDATLWLYTALNFICAFRKSDIRQLEIYYAGIDIEYIKDALLTGTFDKKEASRLVERVSEFLDLKPKKPSKTLAYSNIPNLKLFIPETLKEPFGTILATVLIHKKVSSKIIKLFDSSDKLIWNVSHIRNFFGDRFVKLIENRPFSNLRANKSYLQGIETVGEMVGDGSKAKGYMIAALARSHKGGIDTLSNTTDIYLKDAKFSGYRPEFIIREMFERGIFSFIPAVLLEMITDREYIRLSVGEQTVLIKKLGLKANQVEKIVSSVSVGLIKSKKLINSLISKKETAYNVLQNIASGNAPGRCQEYLCLLMAANRKCEHPDRENCLGCGYEIYTKAAIQSLMKEYAYIIELMSETDSEIERMRYSKILEQTIIPTIAEIIEAAKLLYNESDIRDLICSVEMGIQYVECGL